MDMRKHRVVEVSAHDQGVNGARQCRPIKQLDSRLALPTQVPTKGEHIIINTTPSSFKQ